MYCFQRLSRYLTLMTFWHFFRQMRLRTIQVGISIGLKREMIKSPGGTCVLFSPQLEGLQKAWSSRSPSPLYSPPGASPCGPRSPRLTSPPPCPGSPLLLRRPLRAFTAPLSTLRDTSPPGSPRPARTPGVCSASPAPNSASSHESETERLQR